MGFKDEILRPEPSIVCSRCGESYTQGWRICYHCQVGLIDSLEARIAEAKDAKERTEIFADVGHVQRKSNRKNHEKRRRNKQATKELGAKDNVGYYQSQQHIRRTIRLATQGNIYWCHADKWDRNPHYKAECLRNGLPRVLRSIQYEDPEGAQILNIRSDVI